MASQVSPGIVIKERDLSNAVVTGASAIRAAIASTFRKGPVGKIVNIGSERELIDTFGTPAEANAADWLVASEFLRYGGQLAVVRAATGVLNATLDGTAVLIGSKEAWDAGVGSSEQFAARDAGADGNNLRVVVVDHGPTKKAAKNGHGLSVGDTLSDGVTDHEVYSVIDANNVTIIEGANPAADGNSFTFSDFSASDWNVQPIGSTGLTYKAIGPRPGTSAFASERYLSNDEVHIAVVDESTNTIVERITYVSKISDGKTPEGASSYWKDAVNETSSYIYGSALAANQQTTLGENPGSAVASYGATSGSPKKFAAIIATAGGSLSGGTDDNAYTSGEVACAYDEFLDTEQTTFDFVLMGGSMGN